MKDWWEPVPTGFQSVLQLIFSSNFFVFAALIKYLLQLVLQKEKNNKTKTWAASHINFVTLHCTTTTTTTRMDGAWDTFTVLSPRYVFFVFLFTLLTLFTVNYLQLQANNGQCRPTTVKAGQQRPVKANKGQQRPTKTNDNSHRPTKPNAGQQKAVWWQGWAQMTWHIIWA